MKRDGEVAAATYFRQGGVDSKVSGIGLLRSGKVDSSLSQGDTPLGPTNLGQGIETSVGDKHSVGVSKADVFARADNQSAGYELRVFASLYHTRKPIEGCVGVGAADRFDKSGDDIVVQLAVFVVGDGVLLQKGGDSGVVDDSGTCIGHEVKDIEQFACVAASVAKEALGLVELNAKGAKVWVFVQSEVDEAKQIGFVQRAEDVDLAAGEQGGDDLERGVFGSSANEGDSALLDGAKETVLLRFGEAVDLVDKKDRGAAIGRGREKSRLGRGKAFGFVDDVADFFHTACNGGKGIEGALEAVGDNLGKGSLAYTRRTPEDETGDIAAFDHGTKDCTLANKVGLSDIVVQGLRAKAFGKRKHREGEV